MVLHSWNHLDLHCAVPTRSRFNLIVELRQIHLLSQYWAQQQGETVKDLIAVKVKIEE
ncbi:MULTISPECIES: hypothetical protein [unclassified Leptolyngbya]|uniref:hypothetical protein n=1 Tax=unclassified Leptolyngbya TaxID=2650499 RepID=UPI001AC63411|nr:MULTISPECIES: hypothetical protein [unclassified Leptolyngbya]MBN8560322.1 hypothetical protein [Leptolyngbya sp. UWPOB_LEPTO1]MCY6489900.1 hypothetical protein [Leptolyngbya sp. GGD]